LPALKVVIATVYRSPSSDADSFIQILNDFIDQISLFRAHKLFVFGDLKIDVRNTDGKTLELLNMLRSHNCYCLNQEPTRLNSCIDNVISNVRKAEVLCATASSEWSPGTSVVDEDTTQWMRSAGRLGQKI